MIPEMPDGSILVYFIDSAGFHHNSNAILDDSRY